MKRPRHQPHLPLPIALGIMVLSVLAVIGTGYIIFWMIVGNK